MLNCDASADVNVYSSCLSQLVYRDITKMKHVALHCLMQYSNFISPVFVHSDSTS